MKNIKAIETFINNDIEKVAKKARELLNKQTSNIKPSKQAIELGKKYKAMSLELERIEKQVKELGCRVETYSQNKGEVRIDIPSFSYYGSEPMQEITESDYAKEMHGAIKKYNEKMRKLASLKRNYAIKLLGGEELETILAELAKELAKITQ